MGGRIRRAIWHLWIGLCVTLLVVAVLEGIGSAVRQRGVLSDEHEEMEALLSAASPGHAAWARDYVRELSALRPEWHPYVYWRLRPHRGKYVNVDRAGHRHTWNPTPAPSPDQLRIFMLGGSSMWGIGARDEFTIPSLVSKKLANQGPKGVWVTNFGELGWVSTQEVIALMWELQRGNIPDIVVFYDASNDIYAAFQSGTAGIPQNEFNRIAEFGVSTRGDLWPVILRRLTLYRLSQRVVRSARSSTGREPPWRADSAQAGSLARAVVDTYIRNVELVESWSSRFGFKPFFFWMPTTFTKRNLSPSERREMTQARNRRTLTFARHVLNAFHEKTRMGAPASLHDLSDVFGTDERTVFLDAVHLLEVGNDRVAAAMVHVLRTATGASR